jgi:hypothetical protein
MYINTTYGYQLNELSSHGIISHRGINVILVINAIQNSKSGNKRKYSRIAVYCISIFFVTLSVELD